MKIEAVLHQAHLRYQRQRLNGRSVEATNESIRKGVRLIIGKTLEFRPKHYYDTFCVHDRLLLMTCSACRRTAKLASLNMERLMKGEAMRQCC